MNRTAVQNNVRKLYHYEKFNQAYLTTTLSAHKVHCSDPAALNDPWDCRPWFDENALEEPGVLEDFIQWIFSFAPTSPVSEVEVRATQAEMRRNPEYRRGILNRFSANFLKMVPVRWRIYCVTPVPDSTLMWSHYADNHRGVCLEFGIDDNPLFGSAREVDYRSAYPKWTPHTVADVGVQMLLTKSADWSYEHEYRVFGLGEGVNRPFNADPLIAHGGFLSLPRGAIKAVITGCEADYQQIAQVVRCVAPDVKIKRAARSPSHYRLEIIDCA